MKRLLYFCSVIFFIMPVQVLAQTAGEISEAVARIDATATMSIRTYRDLNGDSLPVEEGDIKWLDGTTPISWAAIIEEIRNAPAFYFLAYSAFQDRFTDDELLAATAHVYKINLETGLPANGSLIQTLQRAVATNEIDLLSAKTVALLNSLTAAEVVTEERATEILETP
jgi:hypothetical protein